MIEPHCCFIREEYFIKNRHFVNMLDPGNTDKQSKRTHICVNFQIGKNNILVPLRNNLGNPIRKFGKIGYPVPSTKRPNAGLDYRYSLVINDSSYLEYHNGEKLPQSQYSIITQNYETISKEVENYVKRYIKVANKHRENKEPLFKVSSLKNFHQELEIGNRIEYKTTKNQNKDMNDGRESILSKLNGCKQKVAEHTTAPDSEIIKDKLRDNKER